MKFYNTEDLIDDLESTMAKVDNARKMAEFMSFALGKDSELLDFPDLIGSSLIILSRYLDDVPDVLADNVQFVNRAKKEFGEDENEE